MPTTYHQIIEKLNAYKSKYYKNLLLKGTIFTLLALLSAFLVINALEYIGNFSSVWRGVLFFSFLTAALLSLYFWITIPVLRLFNLNKPISFDEAANQIGSYFPEVEDRLLNLLQLGRLNVQENALLVASIEQKAQKLSVINFPDAVKYQSNNRYVKYLLAIVLIFLVLYNALPELFTESTTRIVNYSQTFEPQAPFKFNVKNNELHVFKNEDFTLNLEMTGKAIPMEVFLQTGNGRKLKMESGTNKSMFAYTFKKVQKDVDFSFESSGFSSNSYKIKVLERPNLSNFTAYLSFPNYLNKKEEKVSNTGNLIVPAGTTVKWVFNTQTTDSVNLTFKEKTEFATPKGGNTFEYARRIMQSEAYKVQLKNEYSNNKDAIEYYINAIPDEFPTITLKQSEDTTLYNYLILGGNIADDYGITKLEFKYKVINPKSKDNDKNKPYETTILKHNPSTISQSYFHQLEIGTLGLKQGDKLEYFVQVWDNDGIHGSKSSRSGVFEFGLPDREEYKKELEASSANTSDQMEKTKEKAEEVKKSLEELQDRLKGKKKLNWQDKQAIEDLLKKRQELQKEVKEMQNQNMLLNEKQERFDEKSEKVAEKAEQLQELMDELMDEKTRELYEQLQKLLEENQNNQNIQNILEDLEKKENNLEKELDRAMELFKKLQLEQKIEETAKELDKLSEEQKELAEESKETKLKDNEKNTEKNAEKIEDLKEKQQDLSEKFEKVQEEMKKMEKMNEDLQKANQKDMEQMKEKQEEIKQEQEKSEQNLEQQQPQKASENQKKAGEKMKEMSQEMQQMQQNAEQQQQIEDYNDLRKILENLVKLSFDQESLMKEFRKIRQDDPRVIQLGQNQLKLKEDSKIIEDSLQALAKRVFQIQSYVTREVSTMNEYMNESMDEIKKKNLPAASGKQQFAMTSMNNLALMLDETLHQMQQQMGQQMAGMQIINKKRPSPQMGDMQKSLNQQIQDLMKSGKSGKELSQELAKLAAQQQLIRKALKEGMKGKEGKKKGQKDGKGMEGDGGEDGGDGDIGKLLDDMEKTEEDLVNKRITQETLKRQKEILTRLLESEKAMREREQDQKREAEKPKDPKERKNPTEFSEYLKIKEKQVELLKSIPASLNPYYKKEVNEYFKKINE
jgi:hypothetical protein